MASCTKVKGYYVNKRKRFGITTGIPEENKSGNALQAENSSTGGFTLGFPGCAAAV